LLLGIAELSVPTVMENLAEKGSFRGGAKLNVATRDAPVNGTFTKKLPRLTPPGVHKVEPLSASESRKDQAFEAPESTAMPEIVSFYDVFPVESRGKPRPFARVDDERRSCTGRLLRRASWVALGSRGLLVPTGSDAVPQYATPLCTEDQKFERRSRDIQLRLCRVGMSRMNWIVGSLW